MLIGTQIIDRLMSLHDLGYLHLDLKLENLLFGSSDVSSEDSRLLYLIDFGVS